MRKFLSIAFVCVSLIGYARIIPAEEALQTVEKFIAEKSAFKSQKVSKTELKVSDVTKNLPYYVINIAENNGFVLVSADSDSPIILGYSDRGQFDEANLPPQLKKALENPDNFRVKNRTKEVSNHAEGILHKTAEWGQNAPFNDLVPNHAAAGCVSTAMGIVMNYHQWPDYTRGGNQINWYHKDFSLDFDNYQIDWNAISDPNNPDFAKEVAMLFKSTGIATHMMYGENENDESAANVWGIGHRLIQLYAYDKECQYVEKSAFDDEAWNNLLRSQLENIGPVIYRGGEGNSHCFVIDGYDQEGFYHINWGWDGQLNGFFALDFSDVGGMDFSPYQGMVINIKPDRERREYSKAFISNGDNYVIEGYSASYWNFSQSRIDTGEMVTLLTPMITLNTQNGFFRIAVVDQNDNILSLVGDDNPVPGRDYGMIYDDAPFCAAPGTRFEFRVRFPELKEGERYQLVSQTAEFNPATGMFEPEFPSTDPSDFKIILGGMIQPSHFYADNNNSVPSFVNVHIDENLPYLGNIHSTKEHEFSVTSLRSGEYADNYFVPSKGVTLEVRAFDDDGNEKNPVYMEVREEEYKDFLVSFNVSLYEATNDIYVHYEPADPRRTDGLSPDQIIEEKGLIYKINGKECSLIGYDSSLGDEVVIPAVVTKNGEEYKVSEIASEALLHAPAVSLTIDGKNLLKTGKMSFTDMKKLRTLCFENMESNELEPWFANAFLYSGITDVYADHYFEYEYMRALMGIHTLGENFFIERPAVDYYFSALPSEDNFYWTMSAFKDHNEIPNVGPQCYGSWNLPGLGNYLKKEVDSREVPYTELWQYAVDKNKGLIRINNIGNNVCINSVVINGLEASQNEDGLYFTPDSDKGISKVIVNYTINNVKEMTTVYDSDFHQTIESENLSGISNILDSDKLHDVYNLQGIRLYKNVPSSELTRLPAGIYIIDGKKFHVK